MGSIFTNTYARHCNLALVRTVLLLAHCVLADLTVSNYYIILLAFGMALKVVGGLFAFFLHRSLRGHPIIPGTFLIFFQIKMKLTITINRA
mgnify:CR=1 FL=1